MALDYATIDLMKCFVLVLIAAHWSACLWGLPVAPLFLEDPTGTWLVRLGYCVLAEEVDETSGLPTWLEDPAVSWSSSTFVASRGAQLCVNPGQVYLHCLFWGFLMVTGGAEPEMGMHGSATAEQIVYICTLILTQAVNAIVLGTFTTVLLTGSPGKIAFQSNMDALNRYMATQGGRINKQMRRRLREYFHQSRHLQVAAVNVDLLKNLSPALQAELAWKTNNRWVKRVPFLNGTELAFMVEIALNLKPAVFAPGERPVNDKLYIIHRGLALYGGRMLNSGKVWGEDMLLESAELRSPFVCTAMNYLEVFLLTKTTFMEIADEYPVSKKKVRMKTCKMAFRRTIVFLAKQELDLPFSALLSGRHASTAPTVTDGKEDVRGLSPRMADCGSSTKTGLPPLGKKAAKVAPVMTNAPTEAPHTPRVEQPVLPQIVSSARMPTPPPRIGPNVS